MEERGIVVILIRVALAQVTQESPFDWRRITEMNVEESNKPCTKKPTRDERVDPKPVPGLLKYKTPAAANRTAMIIMTHLKVLV